MDFLATINIAQAIALFVIGDLFFMALTLLLQLFSIKVKASHLFEWGDSGNQEKYIKLLEKRVKELEKRQP